MMNENDELRAKLDALSEQVAELRRQNEEQRQGLEAARARISELKELLSAADEVASDPEAE
jgi:uncharacterized coiled-coil DUF342 family protein